MSKIKSVGQKLASRIAESSHALTQSARQAGAHLKAHGVSKKELLIGVTFTAAMLVTIGGLWNTLQAPPDEHTQVLEPEIELAANKLGALGTDENLQLSAPPNGPILTQDKHLQNAIHIDAGQGSMIETVSSNQQPTPRTVWLTGTIEAIDDEPAVVNTSVQTADLPEWAAGGSGVQHADGSSGQRNTEYGGHSGGIQHPLLVIPEASN